MARSIASGRVAASGRAVIGTQNLILRSEDFSNSMWTKTRCSVSSGAVAAPFGGGLADKIVEDTANGIHNLLYSGTTVKSPKSDTAIGAVIFSVWAKSAGRQYAILSETSNTGINETFDLVNGTKKNTAGGSSGMASYGNGWYLLWLAPEYFTPDALWIHLANASVVQGSSGYTGDGTSGIYLWGASAQYVPIQSSVAITGSFGTLNVPVFSRGPYTKTTSAIVNDRTPRTLFPVSNNYVVNSEANGTLALLTSTSGVSDPLGGTAAFTLNDGASAGVHRMIVGTTSIDAYQYRLTCWVKYIDRQYVLLQFNGSGATFDLQNGAVASTTSAPVQASIRSGANGWLKICIVPIPPVASDSNIVLAPSSTSGGNVSFTGSSKSFSWFGLQCTGFTPTAAITATPDEYFRTSGTAVGIGGASNRYPARVTRVI